MSELIFNIENHEYSRDGKILHSVTGILGRMNISDNSHFPKDGKSAMKGTEIHKEIELYLEDLIDEKNMDYPEYSRSALEFLKDSDIQKASTECRVDNGIIAGTVDVIGVKLNEKDYGKQYVIDWKTGVRQDYHALQVAIYMELAKIDNGIVVYLNGTSYKAVKVEEKDIIAGKAIVDLWNWIDCKNVFVKHMK